MSDLPTPINRNEQYLNAIATGNTVDMPAKPITREEQYLDYIARNGGGSGGAENYSQLSGKPQINNVELESGNNSLSALGIASESAVNDIKDGQSINSFSAVESALGNKVDKEAGKGLSENDYSDTEKGKVTANAEAIEAMVNVYGGKNLFHNQKATEEKNGITFTTNADGSITANGTATAETNYLLLQNADVPDNWRGISLILSGCFGGSDSTYRLYLGDQNWTALKDCTDGDTPPFTIASSVTKLNFFIQVFNGQTLNNVTFYPMIRDARITDDTYVPYAMTNRELTDEIQNIPKIKIGQMYYEEVPVDTSYQGFYFGYTDYITNHGNQGVLIAYRVQVDQATAPYSIIVVENRLELLSATSQTVKLTWAPVYI